MPKTKLANDKILLIPTPEQTLQLHHHLARHPLLMIGATGGINHLIIKHLIKQNYPIRAIVPDPSQAQQIFGDQIEVYAPEYGDSLAISPQVLSESQTIIFDGTAQASPFNESANFKELIHLSSQYLKPTNTQLIFDFADRTTAGIWGALNDGVMGGVSQSQLNLTADSAIFTGVVSTGNNGGFASVRTQNLSPPLDLSGYSGIELKVIGDGKRYKFITRCAGQWDSVAYVHSFDTIYNYPIKITIPFAELRPLFRAKTVQDAGPFDSSKIYSMQLMLSKFEYDGILNPKFEAGSFQLTIDNIKAYGAPTTPQLIAILPEQISNGEFANNTAELMALLQTTDLPHTIIQIPRTARRSPDLTSQKLVALCEKALSSPEAVNQSWIVN